MTSFSPSLTIIFAELSVALAVLCGFFIFRQLRCHQADTSALNRLTMKINNNEDERVSMLLNFLSETCGYEEEAANETAHMLVNTEKQFYRTIMEIYKKRDVSALKDLDQRTEHVISAYRNITSGASTAINASLEEERQQKNEQLARTVKDLEERNQSLNDELNRLKAEMDITVDEYTSAFRNRPQADNQEDDQAGGEEAETDSDEHIVLEDPAAADDTPPRHD